jgi:hypothetical protein
VEHAFSFASPRQAGLADLGKTVAEGSPELGIFSSPKMRDCLIGQGEVPDSPFA